MQSYAAWLESSLKERASLYCTTQSGPRFSVLTTVYHRTDPMLFHLTVDSLAQQTIPFFEWIVLAHGPITSELDSELKGLATLPGVTLLRMPENLGIVGGMEVCLKAATGDYIVPMDADDLLTPDALQVLAAIAERESWPAFLYSDEDILVDDDPLAPYWRPDWDPVLNLSSSFIWHLCCIRRDVAVEIGLYSDAAANWCHDWDTVFRIVEAGHQPVHVPEILYHWRQHPISSTNRPDPDSGSRRSTRALLERFIGRTARPDLYLIEDFPIFRGAPEWTLTRRPVDAPPVAVLVPGVAEGSPGKGLPVEGPWRRPIVLDVAPSPKPRLWRRFWEKDVATVAPSIGPLKRTLADLREPIVLVLSPSVAPVGEAWFWEAVKLLEVHEQVKLVHGLIIDETDLVQRGGEVFRKDGRLTCPQSGKPAIDPGSFALALKPHCASAVPTDFFMADAIFLREALVGLADDTPLAGLGIRLSAFARACEGLTAFSPLIIGRIAGPLIDGNPSDLARLAEATLGQGECERAGRQVRGAAGFINHAGSYR